MAEIAIVMLSLFGQVELTSNRERAAHARAIAAANGTNAGRPSVVDEKKRAYATHLRNTDYAMAEIATVTGLSRATLFRNPPPAATTSPRPHRGRRRARLSLIADGGLHAIAAGADPAAALNSSSGQSS